MPINIEFNKLDFPDKGIFHKKKAENVHIYNLRRILPRIINVQDFERKILPNISTEQKEFILTYYVKRNININSKLEIKYILRSLPFKISISDMESFLSNDEIKGKTHEYILHFYSNTIVSGYYVLNDLFNDEYEEHKISKIFKSHLLLITDREKVQISNLLEACNNIEKKDVFYANMHIDPDHSYFFEHKIDHTPGLMLIETARQFIIACAHVYGKVPTSGIFFSMKDINVRFKEYLWLSFPVRIKLVMDSVTYTKEGYWSNCTCKVIFCQEFREKAAISFTGMTIKMDLLEKIIIQKQVAAALEFNSHPGLQSDIVVHEQDSDINYIGTIVDASPKHFIA